MADINNEDNNKEKLYYKNENKLCFYAICFPLSIHILIYPILFISTYITLTVLHNPTIKRINLSMKPICSLRMQVLVVRLTWCKAE